MSKEYEPTKGDVVAVRWYDAHIFKGESPGRMDVISWGKVEDAEDLEYLTIVQSEVQNAGEVDVERVMWGQAIPKESILEVKKL